MRSIDGGWNRCKGGEVSDGEAMHEPEGQMSKQGKANGSVENTGTVVYLQR